MKLKLLFLLFLACLPSFAQYTLIPDVKFENKLIALGIDSGIADGQILTANISSVTSLNVSSSSITDLTGIQDFLALTSLTCNYNILTTLDVSKNTALTSLICYDNQLTNLDVSMNTSLINLRCSSNQLTNLDVSKNTALSTLYCDVNQLTSLDVSKNTALTVLFCYNNKLTNLDVSKNTALTNLFCYTNPLKYLDVSKNTALTRLDCTNDQLTNLDVSKNIALTSLACDYNQLTTLNIQNGNNTNLEYLICFQDNPKLTCIQVDNVAYANTTWGNNRKDNTISFSTNCQSLGIEDVVFDKIAVYPNPTKGEIHIDNCIFEKATAYDALGKLVKTTKFAGDSNNNTINLAGLPSGIYYIYLESQDKTIVKKIILE